MADTLTGDIGSDRTAFATLSALSSPLQLLSHCWHVVLTYIANPLCCRVLTEFDSFMCVVLSELKSHIYEFAK